jgi:hypothetical protein
VKTTIQLTIPKIIWKKYQLVMTRCFHSPRLRGVFFVIFANDYALPSIPFLPKIGPRELLHSQSCLTGDWLRLIFHLP